MCERKLSQLDIDIRTSGIASAQQDPKRLEETRSLLGEAAWAEELGKMMGRNMPRLFQNHFNGEIARTSFFSTSAYLYELAERPDLMTNFFQGFLHTLESNGGIMDSTQ